MASNDQVVFGIPHVQCPSCGSSLEVSEKRRIDKYSKVQRRKMRDRSVPGGAYQSTVGPTIPMPEDDPSEMPEKNYVIVSCSNHACEQDNKIKVFEIPRIVTPSVKVEL